MEERHVANALGGPLELRLHNLRDHSPLKHRMVDDEPYGGGAGMLLRVDVAVAAIEGALGAPLDEVRRTRRVIVPRPRRPPARRRLRRASSPPGRASLLCGRYEGFDHRVHEHVATEALSLGPYVVSGGEMAAMVVIDAVVRHVAGALGAASRPSTSRSRRRSRARIEHPHYTRPASFRGWEVPDVLLSGDHGAVDRWRVEASTRRTEAAGQGDP